MCLHAAHATVRVYPVSQTSVRVKITKKGKREREKPVGVTMFGHDRVYGSENVGAT